MVILIIKIILQF